MTQQATVKFLDAYQAMEKAADDLKNCQDLDQLADIVKTGLEAHNICKDRVTSVRKMIAGLAEEHLESEEA